MEDHVHLLVRMPSTQSVADVARLIKANSSRWVHKRWPQVKGFGWQTGYGAFSVSESGQNAVREYILTNNNITLRDRLKKSLLCFSRRITLPSTKNICGPKGSYAPSGWRDRVRFGSHGLRRGLYSNAATRLNRMPPTLSQFVREGGASCAPGFVVYAFPTQNCETDKGPLRSAAAAFRIPRSDSREFPGECGIPDD
jgi:hypothetical protein